MERDLGYSCRDSDVVVATSSLIGFSVVAGRAIARRGRKLGGEENRVIHSHITAMMTGKWQR
jgi:hypothetical protein